MEDLENSNWGEKGEKAKLVLMDQLGFKEAEIEILKDKSKEEIDQRLSHYRDLAKAFESEKQTHQAQAIVIVNIGLCLDPLEPTHGQVFYELKTKQQLETANRGDYEPFYELTFQGEPLNLNEAAAWIADTRSDE